MDPLLGLFVIFLLASQIDTGRKLDRIEDKYDVAMRLLDAIRQDEQCAHWHESIDAARGEK